MQKEKISVSIDAEDTTYIEEAMVQYDRGASYVVSRALKFARDNGLDLSSGHARETAAAIKKAKAAAK